jgi:hypothetical protein
MLYTVIGYICVVDVGCTIIELLVCSNCQLITCVNESVFSFPYDNGD